MHLNRGRFGDTPQGTNISHPAKRNIIFRPAIKRGYVSSQESMSRYEIPPPYFHSFTVSVIYLFLRFKIASPHYLQAIAVSCNHH